MKNGQSYSLSVMVFCISCSGTKTLQKNKTMTKTPFVWGQAFIFMTDRFNNGTIKRFKLWETKLENFAVLKVVISKEFQKN
jgi:hypothetical protein